MDHATLQALISREPRVAVYLTTPGCGPCRAVRPWVSALFDDPSWQWVEVDTPAHPDVAGQLLVFSHPTLVLFTDGREQARFSRVLPRAAVEQAKAGLEADG